VLVVLELGVTTPRTEDFNRIIKQVERTDSGVRNMDNYRRRIMSHLAVRRAA
jgi:transposase